MATYTSSTAIGQREDLADKIFRIDPEETPIFSNAKKEGATAIKTEWQYQELASASTTNYQNEGFTPSYATPTPTVRVGNYMQISHRDVQISGTLEVIDKAGRARETAYQKVLKGIELRRDIERAITYDTAQSASDPRKAGSMSTWITNANYSTGGTTSALTNVGYGTSAPILTGGDRALVIDFFDDALQQAYDDGGAPSIAVMSPRQKRAFSNLGTAAGAAANQFNQTGIKDTAYIGSVSVYLSDFGRIDTVLDRFMGTDRIFLLDTDYYSICTLPGRNMTPIPLAKTGDAENWMILSEWTLKVQAPKAHAAVYDLS